MPQPDDLIDLQIEKPAAGGRMLARHQGQVVLVWGAIPGERVRARVERVGKGVLYAETVEVLDASEARLPGQRDWRCGGNVLAHIAYARQPALKAEIIRDAFARIARMPLPAPEVIAGPERGYRMRARLHAAGDRIGFFREGSHTLCEPDATGQLLPATLEWLEPFTQTLRSRRVTGVTDIEISEDIAGVQRACHLHIGREVDPQTAEALAAGLVGLSASRQAGSASRVLAGSPAIVDSINVAGGARHATIRLRRDVRAFFQANRYLLSPLVTHVVGLVTGERVLDLYAGVGLFGLSVAATGDATVTLVEGDPVSGRDLESNAGPFGSRVRAERRSVEAFLSSPHGRTAVDTCIVDPPRTGLTRDAIAGVVARRPGRVVYVSCDVATLARDARVLVDAGYALGPLTGYDLFPNTAHVETVAVFDRADR